MQNFHDDPRLHELLPPERQQQLLALLQQLAGMPLQLSEQPLAAGTPVEFNLEPLAWVQCAEAARQAAAAGLLEFVLYFVAKYRLAANMYRDSTEESFDELQRQNEALRASEERYRELSRQLQQRVAEQVGVIEATQQQLYESARLRSIGQLAAGVAHEINNPVGFIASNLKVAADYLDDLEALSDPAAAAELRRDFRSLLDESAEGARRIASIVADLKTFSNVDRADFTLCDLDRLAVAAGNLLQAEFGGRLDIVFEPGRVPLFPGHPARLSQALLNLLDNAARALGPDGRIHVTSRTGGGVVELVIADNGSGIPEAVRPRIFDPFFSTRGVGGGIGLGLTVARDIVVAHGGDIQLSSTEGQGTTVRLRFPLP